MPSPPETEQLPGRHVRQLTVPPSHAFKSRAETQPRTEAVYQEWASASRWLWLAIIIASAAAVSLVVFGGIASWLRPAVTLWFLLVCPGMALVQVLRITDVWVQLVLGISLSLSLDLAVALILLYGGWWHPPLGLAILVAVSLVGVVLQITPAVIRWRPRWHVNAVVPFAPDFAAVVHVLNDTKLGMPIALALIVLLTQKELIRAYGGPRASRRMRTLELVILPTLLLFAAIVIVRFLRLLRII